MKNTYNLDWLFGSGDWDKSVLVCQGKEVKIGAILL
jgi:hypothetical protein